MGGQIVRRQKGSGLDRLLAADINRIIGWRVRL